MRAAIRRWWRRRQGVPFELVYAKGGPEGTLHVTIRIAGDFETWQTALACKRLVP